MKTIPLFIFSLLSLTLSAQVTLMNQVVSMSGVDGRTANFVMSATAGEAVIGSASDAQHHLTQGFQQNLQNFTTSSTSWKPLQVNLQIFPNPSSGTFQVILDKPITNLKYRLMDLMGRSIRSGSVVGAKLRFQELTSGSYLLVLQSGKERKAEKVQIIN